MKQNDKPISLHEEASVIDVIRKSSQHIEEFEVVVKIKQFDLKFGVRLINNKLKNVFYDTIENDVSSLTKEDMIVIYESVEEHFKNKGFIKKTRN
jgi:hypothetical protein